MELLQLRYFYESSKTESFTKVAEKHQVPTTSAIHDLNVISFRSHNILNKPNF